MNENENEINLSSFILSNYQLTIIYHIINLIAVEGSCDEIKSDKLVINHMDEIKDTMLKNNLV